MDGSSWYFAPKMESRKKASLAYQLRLEPRAISCTRNIISVVLSIVGYTIQIILTSLGCCSAAYHRVSLEHFPLYSDHIGSIE
jgi:hypothetical protein